MQAGLSRSQRNGVPVTVIRQKVLCSMEKIDRLSWVDAAKGVSIILVVMMYSAYNTGEYTGQVGFLHYVIGFATPFRMPEFFLISGLFLSQVVSRPWLQFVDRRVVHYLYFYVLWVTIMLGLKIGVYELDFIKMLKQLAFAMAQPYGVLWFVYLLALFGLVTKMLYQVSVPAWAVLPVAIGLEVLSPHSSSYVVTQFAAYFVFFYLGFLTGPAILKLVDLCQRYPKRACAGLCVWAVVNGVLVFSPGYAVQPVGMEMGSAVLPGLHFVLAVAGTLALCIACGLVVNLPFSSWLVSLGKHSLVIYLAFTIPMSLFRAVALKSGLITDTGMLSVLVIIVSIVSSLAVYVTVKWTGIGNFLFERPRWASLLNRKGGAVDAVTATPVTAAVKN
jgi:uncharacterized membrane protein YcfT